MNMLLSRAFVLFVVALAIVTLFRPAAAEAQDATTRPATRPAGEEGAIKILFLGNSFTSLYDVPGKLRLIAAADGKPEPMIFTYAPMGVRLWQHGDELTYRNREISPQNSVTNPVIGDDTWDYVVLQGGSTEAAADGIQKNFAQNLLNCFNGVRSYPQGARAKAILYQTWARHDMVASGAVPSVEAMQAEIVEGYRMAYEKVVQNKGKESVGLAPVGQAFQAANWDLSLYDRDKYHGSPKGCVLAALVIYRTIYNENVSDIPFESVKSWAPKFRVDEEDWASLTKIADAAEVIPPGEGPIHGQDAENAEKSE
jgi:hypothetical protein